MKLYRFSPIKNKEQLLEAILHTHFACYQLCKQSLGEHLPNAGNVGIFCHYDDEYKLLTKIRQELTEVSDNYKQKYFRLHEPITIAAKGNVPETTYSYLYIRKPDPYRYHVGDIDFVMEEKKFQEMKNFFLSGAKIEGARIFDREDLDMIELFSPDVDALGYVSTSKMTERVRVKQT